MKLATSFLVTAAAWTTAAAAAAAATSNEIIYFPYPKRLPWVREPTVACSKPWMYLLEPTATLRMVEARCGTQRTCEAFDQNKFRHREQHRQLRARYGFHDKQQCLNAHSLDRKQDCQGVLQRMVRSVAPVSRANIDAACGGPNFFCTIFGSSYQHAVLFSSIYGLRDEKECRCFEALNRMMAPGKSDTSNKSHTRSNNSGNGTAGTSNSTSTSTSAAIVSQESRLSVDSVCGKGAFCSHFDRKYLSSRQVKTLEEKYGYQNVDDCLCNEAVQEMLESANKIFSRKSIDLLCGEGTFCEVFDPEFALHGADQLALLYGYSSEKQCIEGEAKRKPTKKYT